jgi:hypothetical protein
MAMHGLRVTLQPPDGATFIEDAILTLATGVNGGQLYSGNSGFWIEIVDAPDGSHRVAGFGWQDGDRGHTVVDQVPITL